MFSGLIRAAGAVVGEVEVLSSLGQASQKEDASQALHKAIENIEVHEKLQEKLKKSENMDDISSPILDEYVRRCTYQLKKGKPSDADNKAIAQGKQILFTQEFENELTSFFIHFQNQMDKVVSIQMSTLLPCFEELKTENEIVITFAHPSYLELFIFSAHSVIQELINDSVKQIERILKDDFSGLEYNASDSEMAKVANTARMVHFFHQVKKNFEHSAVDAVIRQTNWIEHNNQKVISEEYHFPPYLVWQAIVQHRFVVYLRSIEHLEQFRDVYQEYSEIIWQSANASQSWVDANWANVHEGMRDVVYFYIHQCIRMADQVADQNEKLQLLSMISQDFHHVDAWWKQLHLDELKLRAAYAYFKLNKIEQSKDWLHQIEDVFALVKNKQDSQLTQCALVLFHSLNADAQEKFLEEIEEGDVEDQVLLHAIYELLDDYEFERAHRLLKKSKNFAGKHIALAIAIFEASSRSNLLDSFCILIQESEKRPDYWFLMIQLVQLTMDSVCHSPKEDWKLKAKLKLHALMIVISEHIKKDSDFDCQWKKDADSWINHSKKFLNRYVRQKDNRNNHARTDHQVEKAVNKRINLAHQLIHAEDHKQIQHMFAEIMMGNSYSLQTEQGYQQFYPVNVPADREYVFSVLGIKREYGMKLLLDCLNDSNSPDQKDVIEIIISNMEAINDTECRRKEKYDEEEMNVFRDYVLSFSEAGVCMPHHQQSWFLDALTLLLQKNLRVFVSGSKGKLLVSSDYQHDESFATLNILSTNANGFCTNEADFNHYIRLMALPDSNKCIQEVKVTQGVNGFFSPATSSQPQPKKSCLRSPASTNEAEPKAKKSVCFNEWNQFKDVQGVRQVELKDNHRKSKRIFG